MKISVVIAVYNAEEFLRTAVESALVQPETGEVILVEDGSSDNALAICAGYAAQNPRVQLVRHPKGENRGAGASFNLGIRHAREEFVAILGADDFYVPDAFRHARHVFSTYPDADGAYAHIGVKYYDPELRALHLSRIPREISGMFEEIAPEELLCALLSGKKGHFSLDSLVMKREILKEPDVFDESLRLGQDTDFIYRLSAKFRFYGPSETTIVAIRGVHTGNRVFDFEQAAVYRRRILVKCMQNQFYGCKSREGVRGVIRRYLRDGKISRLSVLPLSVRRRLASLLFMLSHPRILRHMLSSAR